MIRYLFALASLAACATSSAAQSVLPGKGLSQHPFFYAGEWDYRYPDLGPFSSIQLLDERGGYPR